MKKPIMLFSLIFFIFLIRRGHGQSSFYRNNFVPNPSFEQLTNLPIYNTSANTFDCELLSGFVPYQKNIAFWKSGNINTPDLRIVGGKTLACCRRKYDYCVRPRTGKVMVGIITYMSNRESDTYREFLTLKLIKSIKPNIKTFVELWICKDRKAKLVANNIGFYFSKGPVFKATKENLEVSPQFNHTGIVNSTEQKWEKISGWFIPTESYSFLTIGNFYNNNNTLVQASDQNSGHPRLEEYASYLIDDVRVWQEKDSLSFSMDQIETNTPFRLDDIHFESNSATLLPISFKQLDQLFTFLKDYPSLNIIIQGHTDNIGGVNANLKLSQDRAQAVRTFLTTKGINAARLSIKGFGEIQPITSNKTAIGRATNRRVAFMVLD